MRGKNYPQRVWFLGAGFSTGLGYPVGSQLLAQLIQYLQGSFQFPGSHRHFCNAARKKSNAEEAAEIVQAIKLFLYRYFNVKLDQAHSVDVSEFFTVVHTLAGTPSLFRPRGNRQGNTNHRSPETKVPETELYHALAAAVRTFFLDISDAAGSGKDLPADFRAVLSPELFRPDRDAVVSFNWDEELDIYLTKREEIVFTLPDWLLTDAYLVLKPHGSIGWYDVVQGIYSEKAYFIATNDGRLERSHRRILSYFGTDAPRDIDGTPHPVFSCPPLIMPPTFAKRFEYPEQQMVWSDVLDVCRNARDFIFLGYSLPPDDYLTRAAIRSALCRVPIREIRCLMVGKSKDVLANAQPVFRQGLSCERNFLPWTFGSKDGTIAEKIRRRLGRAKIVP